MQQPFWRRFVRNRPAAFGLAFLAFVVVLALGAPLLFPGDPFRIVDRTFLPPFGAYLFGTDSLGRDIAAGIAHGGRTSLMVGLVASIVAVSIGTLLGAVAGFYRGWIDDALMRFTEFFQTIPTFLFAIVLVAIMSPSRGSIIVAIAVIS